jgi:hypothetical protein
MMDTRPTPPRVIERPDPRQWETDELMTLAEAVALFWPRGPLTVRSLRTAIRDERLPVSVVAGRHLVTKRALKEMSRCTPLPRQARGAQEAGQEIGQEPDEELGNGIARPAFSSSDAGEAAYERLMRKLDRG